jgi:hypothetical protein
MFQIQSTILELPFDIPGDPDGFIEAALDSRFTPETGSAFWFDRARSLEFDLRPDARRFDDLAPFPNLTEELRDVRAADLIPHGEQPDAVGVFAGGGTTGPPAWTYVTTPFLLVRSSSHV